MDSREIVGVQEFERALGQIWEPAMQMDPASVGRWIEADRRVGLGRPGNHAAIALQKPERHERRSRDVQIDCDLLLPATPKPPDFVRRRCREPY